MNITNTLFGILTILFSVVSCESATIENIDILSIEHHESADFPFVVDTFQLDASYKHLVERNYSNYHPLYFGIKRDTLHVDYNLASFAFPLASIVEILKDKEAMNQNEIEKELFKMRREGYADYYKDLNFRFDSIPETWEDSKIKITIDTSQIIRNIGNTKYENQAFIYHAYPVILENISDTAILIGYGSHIPLILELKDQKGHWKAVEFQFHYMCGMGLLSIILPKNEIVLTSVAIMKLEVESELRLRIGGNYSEVFWGR